MDLLSNYPLPSFRFSITMIGLVPMVNASFMEASGFSGEMEVEEVISGGENGYKHKLPGQTKYTNLVLKQGMMPMISPLALWCSNSLRFATNIQIVPQLITLALINEQGLPLKLWNFIGAYPVKYSTSEFKSTENQVAVETLEFAYDYFIAIT